MMTSEERGEVAATAEEVEVRMTVEVNKRKLNGEELSCCSSSLVQLKRRRRIATTGENSDDSCASPSSDHALSSCSSSNASRELAKEKLTTSDLKEDDDEASSVEIATTTAARNMDRRESRETTPLSDLITESAEMKSTTERPSEANSLRSSMASKMPSAAEIEDFFSAAEKHLQKQFAEKYNFDITKEEPLEGRYEWFRVKP